MRITKEMGVSHAEFFAALPRLLGQDPRRVDDGTVVHDDNGRRVTFRLEAERERRIASITLPITRVELSLDGFSAEEEREFMERFDLRFRRGGG